MVVQHAKPNRFKLFNVKELTILMAAINSRPSGGPADDSPTMHELEHNLLMEMERAVGEKGDDE